MLSEKLLCDTSQKEKDIINMVYREKLISRSTLLKKSGMKIATLYRTIELLIKKGVLTTAPNDLIVQDTCLGRPSDLLCLNAYFGYTICISLFRTHCRINLVDFNGTILTFDEFTLSEVSDPHDFFEKIKTTVLSQLDSTSLKMSQVLGIAVSTVGHINVEYGAIDRITNSTSVFLDKLQLKAQLSSIFKKPIVINNIVSSAALGKHIATPNASILGYILINEGISANVVFEHYKPQNSKNFINGLGHMIINMDGRKCECGSYGCLETYCSSVAIVNDVSTELKCGMNSILSAHIDNLTFHDVASAARQNDPLAVHTIKHAAAIFTTGLKNFLNILPVDTLIFGGSVVIDCPLFMDTIKKSFQNTASPKYISVDDNIQHSVAIGSFTEMLYTLLDM
ncbi:MAG: ROK family protein [Angelakisella sp.]